MADKKFVGILEVCRILAGDGRDPLKPARITQLVQEGMPKAARGKYDPGRCMYWYIGKLRGAVERRETVNEDGSSSGIRDERKRLLSAQAEREELELARVRGELVPIAAMEESLAELIIQAKSRLLSVGSSLANQLVGVDSRLEIKEKIDAANREALSALSKTTPAAAVPASPPPASPAPAKKPKKKKKNARAR